MPQGDKSSYTSKQKRKAAHIEQGYKKRGVSTKTAEARAWATVNKQDGGAKKQRSGKKSSGKKSSSRGRKSGGTRRRAGGKASARGRSAARSRSTSRSRR